MRTKEVKAQGQEQARPPRGFGLGPGVLSNKDTYAPVSWALAWLGWARSGDEMEGPWQVGFLSMDRSLLVKARVVVDGWSSRQNGSKPFQR